MTTVKIYKIFRGGYALICKKLTRALYAPIFTLIYQENIWKLYSSYHLSPKKWKKEIWNKYMEKRAASISIDAHIESPIVLPHGVSGIFITQSAKIGKNVVIFQQVTVGANTIEGSKSYGAPIIGNNVYIGAGAKIIGKVTVADNCRIGANTVIAQDIPFNSLAVNNKPVVIQREQIQDNTFKPYLK